MEERIYLGDWLYNAGIIGFLRIMAKNNKKHLIKTENNYISLNTDILEDFHKDYFNYAYTKVDVLEKRVETLNSLLDLYDIKEIKKKVKKVISEYAKLKKEKNKEISDRLNQTEDIAEVHLIIKDLLRYLEEHKIEYKNTDVKNFLGNTFYERKSIFNPTITENLPDKFKEDFILPILSPKEQKEKVYCKVCNERVAKKDTFFDEGTFKLTGTSVNESKNFYWNLIPNTHLCAMCELIYLCTFAGLANLSSIGEYKKYLFVNLDTTVEDLYKINVNLESFVLENVENPFKVAIRNIILDYETRRSRWTLGNILFVEFDTEKEPYKIQHFHIPKYIAKLFEKNYTNFQRLEGFFYYDKDVKRNINVLTRAIDNILEGKSLYPLLNKTIKDFLSEKHNKTGLFYLNQIQSLLKIYKERRYEMEEKVSNELWVIYHKGDEIAKILKENNAENKINSIAYKILSSLRVKDTKKFYDTLLRVYMNLGKEVPSIFLKSFSPDSLLDPEAIGYAFLTGLLGEKASDTTKKEETTNE